MLTPGVTTSRRGPVSRVRRYPPVVAIVVALFLAIAVLPSSLTLPQANPATTLEYAPIPPHEEARVLPPGGNLSSLGLATSGTVASAPDGSVVAGAAGLAGGVGKNPRTKRCVGSPPRQTEDKLSPPCVAYFQGDNFAATYPGVTRDEVRVLQYIYGGFTKEGTSRGHEQDPSNKYFDLSQPPAENDPVFVRVLRGYQRYFNDRYQTYNRFVHFFVYYDRGSASTTPEGRRADAAENFNRIHPFAVTSLITAANEDVYLQSMADKGVMVFGSKGGRDASFFLQYPKLIWGYVPTIQVQAKQFSTYVCTKVLGHAASVNGDGANGQPRRLGLLVPDNPGFSGRKTFATLARKQIEACGGSFAAVQSYSAQGAAVSSSTSAPTTAAQNMAAFKEAGVTTIIWPQGWETEHTKAAARLNYHPEWIVAGDGFFDGSGPSLLEDQTEWSHAWIMSNVVFAPAVDQQLCFLAEKEADPSFPQGDASFACSYGFYENLRQLFTGIQVAGPRLGPDSIDKGFHAIPAVRSTDPAVPACFYERNDYTCVKDAVPMWWDPTAQTASGTPGCWRMPERGQRYFADNWPPGDVTAQARADDPCNNYTANVIVTG